MASQLELSIVVPTFNESANVGRLLELLETTLSGRSYEVVFVDDDSPDGTAEKVRTIARLNPNVRVLRRIGRGGLSSACVEGMLATSAPYIVVMDADLQHDETIIPTMLRLAQQERLDVVVGSRHISGGSMGEFAEGRVALSDWGRRLSQFVCRAPVSDPMSGFFLVDRRFLEEVIYDVSSIGFKILVDLLASASRSVRLGEVPYTFRNRLAGESKLDALVLVEYVQLLVDKLTGSILPSRFLLFAGVGIIGVLMHMSSLALIHRVLGFAFVPSYVAATTLAMTSNFFLNNLVTYRDCRYRGATALFTGWLSFCAACSLGALISTNLANTFRLSGTHWTLASLMGITLGSVWNYFTTQVFTWRQLRRSKRRKQERQRRLLLENPGEQNA